MFRSSRVLHTAAKKEWLAVIYDKPNVDRLQFRNQHIAKLPENFGRTVSCGGGLLGDDGKFIGSTFHIRANTKEDVINFLKKDIYATEGIWDFDSLVVNQLLVAAREEKKIQ